MVECKPISNIFAPDGFMLSGAFCFPYFGPTWPEVLRRGQPGCRSPPSPFDLSQPPQKSNGGTT